MTQVFAPGGPASGPAIASGPDGNLWFTEQFGNRIGRITTAGAITEFTIPGPLVSPCGITAGPDGNLWFVEFNGAQVRRITTAGVMTAFATPTINNRCWITSGPDGNLWLTEVYTNQILRMTTAGAFTAFAVPTANAYPDWITNGPDGNLWFTEFLGNKIGRISTSGAITWFPDRVPAAHSGGLLPPNSTNHSAFAITRGPDARLWYTLATPETAASFAIPATPTVPTLSQWGLAISAVLLLAAALRTLHHRAV